MFRNKKLKLKDKWTKKVLVLQRVTKVVTGGKKMSFRAVVIVGNTQGQVGMGMGKAPTTRNAIQKGITNGKKSLINLSLTSSKSITHAISGKFGAAKVLLRPLPRYSGISASNSTRLIFELGGIKNILSKQLGSDNLLNNAKAIIGCLRLLRSYKASN